MPSPVAPPPSNEPGALTQPRQLQRWLDVNVVPVLTRTQGYFTLPAFSVDAEWRGYSDIVAVFNYTATNNFSLKGLVAPANPNYLACIMWVDDEYNVYRYKLWADVGETVLFDIPLYTNQLIKGNFRIEIWSVFPNPLSEITLAGAGNANANGTYVPATVSTWESALSTLSLEGDSDGNQLWSVRLKASPSTIRYLLFTSADKRFPQGVWDTAWIAVFGGGPNPYVSITQTIAQATDVTIYTSVRGSYDYRFQTDFLLVSPSAIVTDFAWPLSTGTFPLPFVWPADSVPTTN